MENTLKKILLSGLGTATFTYEKAVELIDEMAKKGELTLKQAKELNQELKKKVEDNVEKDDEVVTVKKFNQMIDSMNFATKQDIQELKDMINSLKNN
ncbi:MAG: hypothetical protein PHP06_06255 [Clostridia bacterium]|nr:hypothetical protein [Clostridia bacterium]